MTSLFLQKNVWCELLRHDLNKVYEWKKCHMQIQHSISFQCDATSHLSLLYFTGGSSLGSCSISKVCSCLTRQAYPVPNARKRDGTLHCHGPQDSIIVSHMLTCRRRCQAISDHAATLCKAFLPSLSFPLLRSVHIRLTLFLCKRAIRKSTKWEKEEENQTVVLWLLKD